MNPVQIVVGRNTIDGHPLSARAWGRFQHHVIHELATHGEFYRAVEGTGIDMQNGTEQNMTFLGSWPDGMEVNLEETLNELRVQYEQAVILLIWGELEVIA